MKAIVALICFSLVILGTKSQIPPMLSQMITPLNVCYNSLIISKAVACMSRVNDGPVFDKVKTRQMISDCLETTGCSVPSTLTNSSSCYQHFFKTYYRGALSKCVQDWLKPLITYANSNGVKIDYNSAANATEQWASVGSLMNSHLAMLDYDRNFANDIPSIRSNVNVEKKCPKNHAKSCIDYEAYAASNAFNSLCKKAKSCEDQMGPQCLPFYNFLEQNVICWCEAKLTANKQNMIDAAKSSGCKGLPDHVIQANFNANLGCRKRWSDSCANFGNWWANGL